MEKTITVLGSTGSIGKQTIDVARAKNIKINAIAANSSIDILEEQIREFRPKICAVANDSAAKDLKVRVADTNTRILSGFEGVCEAAEAGGSEILVNSLMGRCGIVPTLIAIESGKHVAMANKEPIVAAGELILEKAFKKGVKVLPVDSEHSAIFQCLDSEHNSAKFIKRLIITASGGPFYGKKREYLQNVTVEEALRHPTWSMGAKITIDSATLMNKGLEFIEAVRLFGVTPDMVDVTVHRQSIVHSMVEFIDGSVLAQMGHPDMRECIQFALTFPERSERICKPLDFSSEFQLTFAPADEDTFSLLKLAKRAITLGRCAPAVMNSANEAAVELFLKKKISFTDIFDSVESALDNIDYDCDVTVDNLERLDRVCREYILDLSK